MIEVYFGLTSKRLILFLAVLSMFFIFGCAGFKSEASKTAYSEMSTLSYAQKEYMKLALESFSRGNYFEAKKNFQKLGNLSRDETAESQAEMGVLLSEFFLCRGLMECSRKKNEINRFLEEQEEGLCLDFRMIVPTVSLRAENIILDSMIKSLQDRQDNLVCQLQEIRDEKEALQASHDHGMRQLQELKGENRRLQEQILELEKLFDLIEQQKRQLFE